MEYQIKDHQQAEIPTVALRMRTSEEQLSMVMGPAFSALAQHVQAYGGVYAGPPYVLYYNMDMQDLDMAVGIPLANAIEGAGQIQAGVIPAGRVISTMHKGLYTDLGDAYQALTEYVQAHHLQPVGIAYEYYHNSPEEVKPEELLTEVVFPIAD